MMSKEEIDYLIEQAKSSSARHLRHRLAPIIERLDLAVSLGLITWNSIADSLGVHRNSLRSARHRAKELIEEWKKTGVLDKLSKTNVKNDFDGTNAPAPILQSGNDVLQSNQSLNDPAIEEERNKRKKFLEAFAKK